MSVSDALRFGHGHSGTVDVTINDNIAVLTMRCTENRFNTKMLKRLNDAMDMIERNPEAHVMVLSGEGRFFSAGLDLPWIRKLIENQSIDELAKFLDDFRKLIIRVTLFPMPTVAVINGHAAAGGAFLSLACDIRIMRRDRGFFYINEVRLALPLRGAIKKLALLKIPKGIAFTEAVILGKKLTGPQTLRLGITSALCEESDLQQAGKDVAAKLLLEGPYMRDTLQKHKEHMYGDLLGDITEDVSGVVAQFANASIKSKM